MPILQDSFYLYYFSSVFSYSRYVRFCTFNVLRRFTIQQQQILSPYYCYNWNHLYLIFPQKFAGFFIVNSNCLFISSFEKKRNNIDYPIPLLYKIIGVLLADSLSVDIFSDETSEAGILYLEDERKIINWKGYLGYFIQSVGLILLLYSLIRYYIVQKDVVNHACKFFIKYAYVLIYLSFLLFEQDLSSYLSPRFLHAATFPLLFPLHITFKIPKEHLMTKQQQAFYLCIVFITYYTLCTNIDWV